jgi:hypothetical protein
MTTTAIPSRRAIDAIVAGVAAGSAYHQARHEVWSAIRDRYDDGAALEALADAIEWAEILDRHVPSQQGSGLERGEFRRLALEALPRGGPMTDETSLTVYRDEWQRLAGGIIGPTLGTQVSSRPVERVLAEAAPPLADPKAARMVP